MSILWAYAHPKEAEGLDLPDSLELGVGKIEASLRLAQRLSAGLAQRLSAGPAQRLSAGLPSVVLGFGVSGAFEGHGLEVGDLCVVAQESLADEGLVTTGGFEDLVALKLAPSVRWHADPVWVARVTAVLVDAAVVRGTTVSTISGTDALAQAYRDRVDAAVESMEGAAVARVCEAFGVPWVQVRAISNRVGDRARGGWDLRSAKARLDAAVRELVGAL